MSPRPVSPLRSVLADLGKIITIIGAIWALATYAAERVATPTRDELHYHLGEVAKAMGPGGAMHDRMARQDQRDAYIVDAIAALCRDTGAACPPPTKLVQER